MYLSSLGVGLARKTSDVIPDVIRYRGICAIAIY
jgi:hypothetical protein